ncbi:DUF3068 domain-containing protein [Aeromicrobium duanguangcaii]|uniref:DUF3068 domain-containing protein n=1 Tax=Aeromicrobium duanguangcaii TaxID=2968086 RepID=UPI0027411B13|nr:DUF3068 domain-containing protein [Aeromicrobium duanguangcaii]
MRKFSRGAVAFLTLGAFLLTMGVAMKVYAYDRLAVVPNDQNTQQILSDDNANFFDADNVAPGSGPITTVATVIGDPDLAKEAADENDGADVAVFTKGQSTDNNDQAPPVDFLEQTFAVDRFTGEAVPWSGASQNGEPIEFEGLLIKFPFNTQKKSYDYWDATVKAPMKMEFEGTEEVEGTDGSINTYRFSGSIDETEFGIREVPRGVFGLPDTGSVEATRTYANDRTIWVEPETGVMVKIEEAQKQWLKLDEPGAKDVVAMDTISASSPETIQANIDEYGSKSASLKAVRTWLPLAMGGLGILSILAGLALAFRFRSRRDSDVDHDAYANA